LRSGHILNKITSWRNQTATNHELSANSLQQSHKDQLQLACLLAVEANCFGSSGYVEGPARCWVECNNCSSRAARLRTDPPL